MLPFDCGVPTIPALAQQRPMTTHDSRVVLSESPAFRAGGCSTGRKCGGHQGRHAALVNTAGSGVQKVSRRRGAAIERRSGEPTRQVNLLRCTLHVASREAADASMSGTRIESDDVTVQSMRRGTAGRKVTEN